MPTAPVLAAVIGPTAKVAHLGSTALTVALAAIPALVIVARGGSDVTAAIVLLTLAAGASVAWAVDDPTEELLASTPVSAPVRASIRVVAAAAVAGSAAAAIVAVVVTGPGVPPGLGGRFAEGIAAGAIALAVAFAGARRGERMPGASGVIAGVLGPAVVAGMATRWPTWLPSFQDGPVHSRWWLLAAAAALAAAWSGRDVSRR